MKILIGMSFLLLRLVIVIGQITAVTPRMSRTLKIFEPMTLPMAISALPCKAPMKLTTISGAEVPIPTMVRPMTKSLIPSRLATDDAPSTSQSAPFTIKKRPTRKMKIWSNIVYLLFSSSCNFASERLLISSSERSLSAQTFSTCIV